MRAWALAAGVALARHVSMMVDAEGAQEITTDSNVIEDIEGFLRQELGGKKFTYVVNQGNAGDSLIQYGTLLTFDSLGLDYDLAAPWKEFRDTTLVYAGAGNLVGLYPDCRDFLNINAPPAKGNTILLLPATVKNEDSTLKRLGGNVKVMARERISFDYVQRFLPASQVYLAKDMAFQIPKYDTFLKTARESKPAQRKVAMLYRTDTEATSKVVPRGNIDLSAQLPGVAFDSGVHPEGVSHDAKMLKAQLADTAHKIFKHMQGYTEVWTNRLHMCISASIMDREAHCQRNSYWKNKAIFEFAIRPNYPNAHFEDDSQVPILAETTEEDA
mmetsp:Transcript_1757/g.3909  ORF Transcript_1757/g.3909 Transcript_1757/m.3909 type:complete len:329 (+) Transcript_1757:61-1047(+)